MFRLPFQIRRKTQEKGARSPFWPCQPLRPYQWLSLGASGRFVAVPLKGGARSTRPQLARSMGAAARTPCGRCKQSSHGSRATVTAGGALPGCCQVGIQKFAWFFDWLTGNPNQNPPLYTYILTTTPHQHRCRRRRHHRHHPSTAATNTSSLVIVIIIIIIIIIIGKDQFRLWRSGRWMGSADTLLARSPPKLCLIKSAGRSITLPGR